MATETQDPLGEAPVAAPESLPPQGPFYGPKAPTPGLAPGMGVIAPGIPAAQILGGGTAPDLARMAAAQMPMPDSQEYQLAKQKSADAWQSYLKTGEDQKKAFDAQKQETNLAAQQYAERAKSMLPQPMAAPPAPSRGLRPFLASTANEDPYTTLSKFMQSVTLLATMMGGGRDGARASVSALTGAIEGWTKGDRYQADAAYQTWKDTTDAMFKQFDDEMRAYNSLMIAERVPLEQKLRALETTAWDHKNTMAQKAFEVGKADQAVAHLDQMRQAGVKAMMDAAAIQGSYDKAQQDYALRVTALEAQIEKTKRLLDAKAAEGVLKDALAARTLALKEAESGAKIAALEARASKAELGKAPPEASQKVLREVGVTDQKIGRLLELMDSPNVDINKIVGGVRPWINSFIQKWGNGRAIPEGATAGPVNTKLIKGRLTDDEQEFLARLQDYGDSILRRRSGAAIGAVEMNRMMGFVPDQGLTPQAIKIRLLAARQENLAAGDLERAMLRSMKVYEVPDVFTAPPIGARQAPAASAPAPGSKLEGNEWVSESGKYVWRNGAWVTR